MMQVVKNLFVPSPAALADEVTDAQRARAEAERHREDAAQRKLLAESRYDSDPSPANEDELVRARLAEERAARLLAQADAKASAAAQKAADAERAELKKKLDAICDELEHERRVTERTTGGKWRVVPDGGRGARIALRLGEIYLEARKLVAEAVELQHEQEAKAREAVSLGQRIGDARFVARRGDELEVSAPPMTVKAFDVRIATKAACFEQVMLAELKLRAGGEEGDLDEWLVAERQGT